MNTKAVRLYGANDLRLESFELPEISKNEILVHIITDGLCPETLHAVKLGDKNKRIVGELSSEPVIIGHEACGEIVRTGAGVDKKWSIGDRVVILPSLKSECGAAFGYSFKYMGGAATYVIVSEDIIANECLVKYGNMPFFTGSLVEPLAAVWRAYQAFYHVDAKTREIKQGVKRGGKLAILGGAGPMGMAAIEIGKKCMGISEITVVDTSDERLDFAKRRGAMTDSAESTCTVTYVNTHGVKNAKDKLLEMSGGGFDDVFVMSSSHDIFELAENICCDDGCLNFFADPSTEYASAPLNLNKLHYHGLHVVGTAGSDPTDAVAVVKLIEEKKIDPAVLVSHIVGMNDCIEATLDLDKPLGAKKVCYMGIDIPYIAIEELEFWGESDPHYQVLAEIVKNNGGLWCEEAERYLVENAPRT